MRNKRIVMTIWERKVGDGKQLLLTVPKGCGLKKGDIVEIKKVKR